MKPRIVDILHPDGSWSAHHSALQADGPLAIKMGGKPLVENTTHYLDDLTAETMLLDRFRAFRKGGCAVVQTRAHYPFGAEVGIAQSFRYAANHVRITSDLRWRAGAQVDRHLGLGCLNLPGSWKRFYCVPPCSPLSETKAAVWQDIPATAPGTGMIGHWHRPPLALVFERADGALVEVATGDDLWRWERNLGFGPEAGNYKIMMTDDGLEVIREPLMTCAAVTPMPRDYRMTWHLAWAPPSAQSQPPYPRPLAITFDDRGRAVLPQAPSADEGISLLLDVNALPFPSLSYRSASPSAHIRGERLAAPCWHSRATQKLVRAVIRQLAGLQQPGWLTVTGIEPGVCWDPSHLDHTGEPMAHWDAGALLNVAVWARQQLGPEWHVRADCGAWNALPSMASLFTNNGFRTDGDGGSDDED